MADLQPTTPAARSRPRTDRPRVELLCFDFAHCTVPLADALAARCDVLLQVARDELAATRGPVRPEVVVRPFAGARLRQPLRQRTVLRRVRDVGERFGADVVHVQQGHLWWNLDLLRGRPAPVVVTVHDPAPHAGDAPSKRTPERIMRIPFHRADHLIVHSEAVRRELVDRRGIPDERITTVPLLAAPITTYLLPQDPHRPPTVLFFGRIWPFKGLDVLLRAEPAIAAAVPDLRIVVAGTGEPWTTYAPFVDDPARYDLRLRYVDEVERDLLFRDADVVVLPYLDASQSGVVAMANKHGRAVVASDVAGLSEQVADGVSGLLVPPGDVQALTSAVVSLLRNPRRRNRLAAAGRERHAMRAAPTAVAARTIEAYERARVASGRSRRAPATRSA